MNAQPMNEVLQDAFSKLTPYQQDTVTHLALCMIGEDKETEQDKASRGEIAARIDARQASRAKPEVTRLGWDKIAYDYARVIVCRLLNCDSLDLLTDAAIEIVKTMKRYGVATEYDKQCRMGLKWSKDERHQPDYDPALGHTRSEQARLDSYATEATEAQAALVVGVDRANSADETRGHYLTMSGEWLDEDPEPKQAA